MKQSVTTSQSNRNKAADRAKNFTKRPYNANFVVNKTTTNGSAMNCSQLVWSAYKGAVNIDLDANGGPGVYPFNIRDSKHTKTYKTL